MKEGDIEYVNDELEAWVVCHDCLLSWARGVFHLILPIYADTRREESLSLSVNKYESPQFFIQTDPSLNVLHIYFFN